MVVVVVGDGRWKGGRWGGGRRKEGGMTRKGKERRVPSGILPTTLYKPASSQLCVSAGWSGEGKPAAASQQKAGKDGIGKDM